MLFYLDNWMSADPNGRTRCRSRSIARSRDRPRRVRRMPPAGTRAERPQAKNAPNGPERELRPRADGAAHARRGRRLHAEGRHRGRARVHRAGPSTTRGRAAASASTRACTTTARRWCSATASRPAAASRDGEQVLDILAKHPATARFIATKLARRFVSDTPPPALVDRAAARFRATDGDLREVMRTILTSPEFLAPEAYRAKVKTPFEFVVSAAARDRRRCAGRVPLVRSVQQLGMPLYQCQPPTGYKDTADAWVNTGALVSRMNFALHARGQQACAACRWRRCDRRRRRLAGDCCRRRRARRSPRRRCATDGRADARSPEFQRRCAERSGVARNSRAR